MRKNSVASTPLPIKRRCQSGDASKELAEQSDGPLEVGPDEKTEEKNRDDHFKNNNGHVIKELMIDRPENKRGRSYKTTLQPNLGFCPPSICF